MRRPRHDSSLAVAATAHGQVRYVQRRRQFCARACTRACRAHSPFTRATIVFSFITAKDVRVALRSPILSGDSPVCSPRG